MKKFIFVLSLLISNVVFATDVLKAGDRVFDTYRGASGVVQEAFSGGPTKVMYDSNIHGTKLVRSDYLHKAVFCYRGLCQNHRVFDNSRGHSGVVEEAFSNGIIVVKFDDARLHGTKFVSASYLSVATTCFGTICVNYRVYDYTRGALGAVKEAFSNGIIAVKYDDARLHGTKFTSASYLSAGR